MYYTPHGKLLEVISENEFEVEFVISSLADSIGVCYTYNELCEIYGDGSHVDYFVSELDTKGIYGRHYHIVFFPNIISAVLDQLKTRKTASIPLSAGCMSELMRNGNDEFKPHGFMFSAVKGIFVPWKESVKKVKPRVLPSVMSTIKIVTARAAITLVMNKYGLDPFKSKSDIRVQNEQEQMNAIKLAFDNGFTIQDILNFNENGWITNSIYLQDTHPSTSVETVLNKTINEIDRELVWLTFHNWVNKIS